MLKTRIFATLDLDSLALPAPAVTSRPPAPSPPGAPRLDEADPTNTEGARADASIAAMASTTSVAVRLPPSTSVDVKPVPPPSTFVDVKPVPPLSTFVDMKPVPRLSLETSLVPVEELLARHGVVGAASTPRGSALPIAAGPAREAAPQRRVLDRRRVVIAAIASLLLIGVALCLRSARHRSNDTVEPTALLPQREPSPASRVFPRAPQVKAPAPPSPSGTALRVSLDRAASDAVIEGRYEAAADTYERLARATPTRPVYREAARILRQRLASTKNQ